MEQHLILDGFRQLIRQETGIAIGAHKDYLLVSKLNRLLAKSQFSSLDELYEAAVLHHDGSLIEGLINQSTTNHTYFFREPAHFRILRKDIVARGLDCPLIWVAASSTGEEVYSIIIELLEAGITGFKVMATDINREVLIHMKQGIYPAERLVEVSGALLKKYFKAEGTGKHFKVRDELKSYLVAKRINLVDPVRFQFPFDYIFCRNVLYYFDEETKKTVVHHLLQNLDPQGYLFISHSESLYKISDEVETVFTAVYNKKAGR